jgi:hypothetical protein
VVLGACGRFGQEADHRRAEAAGLTSQIDAIEDLIAKAERGESHLDEVVVGASASLVRSVLAASLPLEQVLAGQFRVVLTQAEVHFRAGRSSVTLRGRVSPAASRAIFADVVVEGELDRLRILAGRGTLAAEVVLRHVEVVRAASGGADSAFVRSAVQALGHEGLASLARLVPRLAVPIRIDQSLAIAGLGAGPVSVAPGELPFRATVTSVVPLDEWLWVTLDLSAGPWRRRP